MLFSFTVDKILIVSIRISPISYLTVPASLMTTSGSPVEVNLKTNNLPVVSFT